MAGNSPDTEYDGSRVSAVVGQAKEVVAEIGRDGFGDAVKELAIKVTALEEDSDA